jgi:hypothetical protein
MHSYITQRQAGEGKFITSFTCVESNRNRIYYLLVALNATSTLLFVLFYYPPTFGMKHDASRKWEFVKNFDYLGMVIAAGGLILFIIGLSSGGVLYPWDSARVISTTVIGFCLLVGFFVYETYADLKEPFLPVSIFKNRGYFVTLLLWGTGSALYYANAILWPSMCTSLYNPGHSWVRNGFLASIPGSAILLGEMAGAVYKRYTNRQLQVLFPLVGVLLACKSYSHSSLSH